LKITDHQTAIHSHVT